MKGKNVFNKKLWRYFSKIENHPHVDIEVKRLIFIYEVSENLLTVKKP